MKLQKVRNAIQLISLMLFPVTINYLSPYLIVTGSFEGVISGSFILFTSLFLTSLIFGRAFCGWVCPVGCLQDYSALVNDKPVNKKINVVKYIIWIPWLISIIAGFITAGGIKSINPIYLTDYGVSVNSVYSYLIYLPIVALVICISFVFGRRAHCHGLCWIAPFVIIGTKISKRFRYPSLHLECKSEKCSGCGVCNKNCPMSLDVKNMVKQGGMHNDECILCGKCSSVCSKNAINFSFKSSLKTKCFSESRLFEANTGDQ